MNAKLIAMTIVGCLGAVLSFLALEKFPSDWGWIAVLTVVVCAFIHDVDCDCGCDDED